MMKRKLLALCLTALLALPMLALADASGDTNAYDATLTPIAASLNQKMALRSGPGTKYTELGTYPQSTPIVVYEQEIGGSVSWAMLEFRGEGGLIRAYTGMKRIDSDKTIPWANTVTFDAKLAFDATPRRGPGEEYASLNRTLRAGAKIVVYHAELGYVMADFTFPGDEQMTRAWIPEICLSTF